MKLKFNRNVNHNGVDYLQGHVYDMKDDATAQHLLSLTHTDVFVRQREGDFEDKVEVKLAEVAPESVQAEAQPASVEKTPNPVARPAMQPAPDVDAHKE